MELIDRQALLDAIEKDVYASDSVKSFVRCVAKGLPTIDAVKVVRCKDCIHLTCTGWCGREFDWYPVEPDDFCSKGA